MCGIAGFFDPSSELRAEQVESIAGAMTETLVHRGPDDGGTWCDASAGVALGSRRLAIVDLSQEGHQPMVSASGRFVIAFNGEIYNFRDLRRELESAGDKFRGHSDTEVALAAIERWELRGALDRFNGMFAFALWDVRERTLMLARDRLGEKPLYYGRAGRSLIFGSELKALRVHPDFDSQIDRMALAQLLRHKYIPSGLSIYEGVSSLPPGHFVEFREGQSSDAHSYWSVGRAVIEGEREPFLEGESQALEGLDGLLRDSVQRRMVADVPLGAFLSGGLDSSTIVALMQAQSETPVKTFTIGFADRAYDESRDAAAVAKHLGTEHTELIVSPQEAQAVIPRLPEIYDEPFADSSQIPTFLVSQLARQHVTVSLSGDGGDEIFGGYNRYSYGPRMWNRVRHIPRVLREPAGAAISAVSPRTWDRVLAPTGQRMAGDKMHKLAGALSSDSPTDLYRRLTTHWPDPESSLLGVNRFMPHHVLRESHFAEEMMADDTAGYLPDDILTKLDRATMSVGLEGRVPFLDHRVVEFAWRLPLSMKIRNGKGKWILRQLLSKYVPPALTNRPKMGFGVPIYSWLRGPLRPWAEDLLDPARLKREGYLRPEPVRRVWQEHLSGKRNNQYLLWDVLMFQQWLEHQKA